MQPGIHTLTNEDYHAAPGISKTGLWTIHTKTPFHFRHGERKASSFFDLGSAAHTAVLEPDLLDKRVAKGPADRRGAKWQAAVDFAEAKWPGITVLPEKDYERVLRIRDSADKNATLRALRPGLVVEQSGFAIDPVTGVLCRCRPDGYQPSSGIILDLKTTTDGGASSFAKSVANYGYHVQDAFYSDVWEAAYSEKHGIDANHYVLGFVFVVVETTAPYVTSTYEFDPSAVDEGRAIYRAALARYAECARTDVWPAYPDEPEPLKLPRWAHKLTPAPDYREEEI